MYIPVPKVGEFFVSHSDTVCLMVERDMYIDYNLTCKLPLAYIIGSIFSKKRQATNQEISLRKVTIVKGENTVNTEFNITLEDGHNMAQGLKTMEAAYIEHVYKASRYNQSKAAINLGLSRGTLRAKLKEYFGEKYL